jgi:hypothetical protein
MYCLAVTVLVVNGCFSESSSGVGRGKDRETRQAHETNLVADGAVVFHGVLDAAVLLVAQCGRVARPCVKMDVGTRIR